jgi:hypothetical protein
MLLLLVADAGCIVIVLKQNERQHTRRTCTLTTCNIIIMSNDHHDVSLLQQQQQQPSTTNTRSSSTTTFKPRSSSSSSSYYGARNRKWVCQLLLLMLLSLLVPWRLSHSYFDAVEDTRYSASSFVSDDPTVTQRVVSSTSVNTTTKTTTTIAKVADNANAISSSVSSSDATQNNPNKLILQKKKKNKKENVNVTVWMLIGAWQDFGHSFLKNELLERFGSTFHYTTEWVDTRSASFPPIQPPCLIGGNAKGLEEFRQRHGPHCYTVVINDEYCNFLSYGDARFYFQADMPLMEELDDVQNDAWITTTATTTTTTTTSTSTSTNTTITNKSNNKNKIKTSNSTVFLPLGPRFDFYKVLQDNNYTTTRPLLPTSDRQLIFNAIFSKSTSPSRQILKEYLIQHYDNNTISDDGSGSGSGSRYHIQIAYMWRRVMNPKRHATPEVYADILHRSQFTLSPTGHNPECFRIYEAIEAGSIPIVIVGDGEYDTHPCRESMRPLLLMDDHDNDNEDTPLVVLKDWNQLNDTLTRLLQDPMALNRRQAQLRRWYHDFMRRRVLQLEALLMRPRML